MIIKIAKYLFFRLLSAYDARAGNDGMTLIDLGQINVSNARVLHNRDALVSKMTTNGNVAEIGVNKGKFSKTILKLNKPRRLHLIDCWGSIRYSSSEEKFVRKEFNDEITAGTIIINKGLSTEVLTHFEDAYFDWVYIDSDHGYQVTMAELILLDSKIRENGIIAGHDYTSRSRLRARRYGVIEAVHEFCSAKGYEFIFITLETHGHNSFAIRKISKD